MESRAELAPVRSRILETLRTSLKDAYRLKLAVLVLILVALAFMSFRLGRFSISFETMVTVLFGNLTGAEQTWNASEQTLVMNIRLPRILAAMLIGAAMAAAGASYQSTFRNPLVSPGILGVSAGAGFGASLSILLGLPWYWVQVFGFIGGLAAAAFSLLLGWAMGGGSMIILVLGGIVIATTFDAMISITQYVANPNDTLPQITFWLMGGLGKVRMQTLGVPAAIVAGAMVLLFLVRWSVTVLAVGDDEARTLGIDRRKVLGAVILSSTLMTSTVVSMAGIIGWVGLLIPHLARSLVGPSFHRLLPATALMGAIFMLIVDNVARSLLTVEIPLGILTALIGAPFFVLMLWRSRRQWF